MPNDAHSNANSRPPADAAVRRVLTSEESAQHRHRPPTNRFSTSAEAPNPGIVRSATDAPRRRGSNYSDYSLNEARRSFQSSTDDLLLPKPSATGLEPSQDSSPWHSAPLAFALLPAVGGMLFKNGSSIVTDIMLLGLAAVFLNWSVRVPWDWYHSAQATRKREEYNEDTAIADESDSDNELGFSQTTLDEVPEDEPVVNAPERRLRKLPGHEAAANELYMHEVLALLSCFIFPLLGAYLLHTIRSQLSRPSEGLVSDYNLTIFLLASELRPMAHLVKLIRSRTLHLQRVVNSQPFDSSGPERSEDIKELLQRLADLEARESKPDSGKGTSDAVLSAKQVLGLTAEVRRGLQPDLDSLTRAVRRYEKRAALQTFQTDSRLHDLESRLNDAISLAAAAANNGLNKKGFTGIVVEWIATAIVLPVHAFGAVVRLPWKTFTALINYGQKQKFSNGKPPTHGRAGDRIQGRGIKR